MTRSRAARWRKEKKELIMIRTGGQLQEGVQNMSVDADGGMAFEGKADVASRRLETHVVEGERLHHLLVAVAFCAIWKWLRLSAYLERPR